MGLIGIHFSFFFFFDLLSTVSSVTTIIVLVPEQTVYIVEETVLMRCIVENPSTIISYSFFKDGAMVSENSSNNVLIKSELRLDDSGFYFCTYIRHSAGTHTESNTVRLNIIDRPDSPSISVEPDSSFYFLGQLVIVTCLLKSRSDVTAVNLYQDMNEVTGADNFGVLTFQEIRQRNSGNYTCVFHKRVQGREVASYPSRSKSLIVTEPLPTPTLSLFPNRPQIGQQRIQLICQTPLPSTISGYRFYQNGREITEKPGSQENVLIMQSYISAFEGCYFCKTFKIQFGQEIQSSESNEQFLTDKATPRECKNTEQSGYASLSSQGLKFYGSILIGKFIVLVSVMMAFGVQLSLIRISRRQKSETQMQHE
ncbi:uncharacterized protein RCH25_036360 [Pelodytes ibericus]